MARTNPIDVVTVMSVPTKPTDAALHQLAVALGVATNYWSQNGQYVEVDSITLSDVIAAMGVDASSADSVATSLLEVQQRPWRMVVPPAFVVIAGDTHRLPVHVPHGSAVEVRVVTEDNQHFSLQHLDYWVEPQEIDGQLVGEASFTIPDNLPLGWHTLHVSTVNGVVKSYLVVTPRRLQPNALAGSTRRWGFMLQLYAITSEGSWGIGDICDAQDLAVWSADAQGADFLLLNPMHASTFVSPVEPSPYLPSTRRFANPIYVRPEQVFEYAQLSATDQRTIAQLQASIENTPLIDRDRAWGVKGLALQILFQTPLTLGRQAALNAYIRDQGDGLVDFATWSALAAQFGSKWSKWPSQFQHPRSTAVGRWREENAIDVQWHMWLQWITDEQLGCAQWTAERAGMAIGMVHDLAVGVAHDGADAWALQDVLAQGVSVGAPPDMYNQKGQDWSQPPWRPDSLAAAGFLPYRDMLRTLLRNSGGIRIDHILGLFRMWWIPTGNSPDQGTYVSFDHDALVGILALEAQRADAVIIGEDLGTVEPWVQDVLARRGLLGTSILWFERDGSGQIIKPEDWRREVLASVTVHDLPPTAGYLAGEHVRLRHELSLLAGDLASEMAADATERGEWMSLLQARGLLEEEAEMVAIPDVVVALHALLGSTPARLIGVSLPDVVGDVRAQNQPGTYQEYPNWQIPITNRNGERVQVEDLPRYELTETVVAAIQRHL